MSRESTLAAGRKFQAESFTDTILAGSYTETPDETTLATIRTITATHYTGPALVKFASPIVSEDIAVGQQFSAVHLTLKVPFDAPLIPTYDLVIVTASADPALIGRQFRIKAAPQSGAVTSHRYTVEELS